MMRVDATPDTLPLAVEPDHENPFDVVTVGGERLHQRDRIQAASRTSSISPMWAPTGEVVGGSGPDSTSRGVTGYPWNSTMSASSSLRSAMPAKPSLPV